MFFNRPLFDPQTVQIARQYQVDEPVPSEPTQERQLTALRGRRETSSRQRSTPIPPKKRRGKPRALTSSSRSCSIAQTLGTTSNCNLVIIHNKKSRIFIEFRTRRHTGDTLETHRRHRGKHTGDTEGDTQETHRGRHTGDTEGDTQETQRETHRRHRRRHR